MKKNIHKIIVVAGGLLALVSVAVAGQLQITHPAAGDTPPAGGTPPSNLYVAISKYKAANSGVNFAATETTQNGQVTSWLWNFANGSPSTSSQESPGVVTFSAAAAYGNSNACTVNLAHTSTDQNGQLQFCTPLTGFPIATINVNVVKPKLVFKTDRFTTENESATRFVNDFGMPNFGNATQYMYHGNAVVGCGYEYDYTIDGPNNSGALSTDMAIIEHPVRTYVYSQGNTEVSRNTVTRPVVIYHPRGYFSYNPLTPPPLSTNSPANTIMYACDEPAFGLLSTEDQMAAYSCNTFTGTIVLTSSPLFQDPSGTHEDTTTTVSHTFTTTCVSDAADGTGPYHWTASY